MAETLRELVVALSLDSSNFSRNMRTINQQIKEAEPTFRLAGAGVENYEKTIAGTEAKLSMLGNKLTQQQRAVEQYSRVLVAANPRRPQRLNPIDVNDVLYRLSHATTSTYLWPTSPVGHLEQFVLPTEPCDFLRRYQ